jgi:Xaa-Pro aminopeptidase
MDQLEQSRRLKALRRQLERHGLAAYVVPKSDEYVLEYAPASSERLAWLSGFTGSAGLALVARQHAALFVDGRYTEQALQQSSPELWEHHHIADSPPSAWLERVLGSGERVGYDPRVHTPASLEGLRGAVESAHARLVPIEGNLVDAEWSDRPAEPLAAVELYPEAIAGESSSAKRARMAAQLVAEGQDALVVSAPESLAWLLNIRGGDVQNTPLALGRAILRADASLSLYMEPQKLGSDVRATLGASRDVEIAPLGEFVSALGKLGARRVRVDQASASEWIVERLRAAGALVDIGADPCTLAKAQKTAAELAGIRAAHVRDGAALARFFKWFDETAPGDLTEWTASEKLAELRARSEHYRGPSFSTISAFGPSSALPHYRATRDSARKLESGNVYLVDSGGQYVDGTTDITRVTVIGEPSAEMRRRYTEVLKGHIALSCARFPAGTTGSQLDPFARQFLWQAGVDFDHGTGHGVGCFLGVHEGPQNISKRPSKVELRPGMVVSNEPGYYKPGAFGIRIENLVVVVVLDPQPPGAERKTLGFETLSVAPYERRLIDVSLLGVAERAWIDAYHRRVREQLAPLLEPDVAEHLVAATAPLLFAGV